MRDKILEIISKKNPMPNLQNAIGEVILKDDKLMFTIDITALEIDKNSAEKFAKICEEEILHANLAKKVSVILVAEKKNMSHQSTPSASHGKDHQPAVNFSSHGTNAAPHHKDIREENSIMKNLRGEEILPVKGVKKIIAIASAKGGVGKSTLAANIAISLQRVGVNVALVDADIHGPSIPHLMNLQGKPAIKDNLILPHIAHKVKCVSVGSLIDENQAGVWRGAMITKILYQLIRAVNWNFDNKDVDVMIIDMPPGTGDVYLSLAEKFPLAGVAIVSTPQSLAIIDVVRSIDCFKKLQIPILGLIQNMSYLEINGEKKYIFGKDGAKDLSQKLKIKFLGELPLLQEISDSAENKMPFVAFAPSSTTALEIGKIAEKIL